MADARAVTTRPLLRLFGKRRLTTALAKYAFNPIVRTAVRLGLAQGWAILETRGRKSGQLRHTPVGNGLVGDTFWIVAEHGRRAGYVRNIAADPNVRVLVGRKWRSGHAHLMPDDDPLARQRKLGRKLNAVVVRTMGTDLLTVRIELDSGDMPSPAGKGMSDLRAFSV
jgi:deazaflavin-dependent oxidoreductase (nitroreductase family)